MNNPFSNESWRPYQKGEFTREELSLANRNSGIALEALRYDLTPTGLHYLLNHFDIPYIDPEIWCLEVKGQVDQAQNFSLEDIQNLPAKTLTVTLECAGNGRGLLDPRYPSMPWINEAVGTAEWTGTPLRNVLNKAGLGKDTVEVVFTGADHGFDFATEHSYARSLKINHALDDDVLLVYAMNGALLLPQHGFPLRLIVPGWYGMASVKWLKQIETISKPFDGPQQIRSYQYRESREDPGKPVTVMRVRSLLIPPGIPDWYTRYRLVDRGKTELIGRAWSGAGVPITAVNVAINDEWHTATIDPQTNKYAWARWSLDWRAEPGEYELSCRATDANGDTQPLEPFWNHAGVGNNMVQHVKVFVR